MIFINISGANATGKSTRVTCLYKYLKTKYKYSIIEYKQKPTGVFFKNCNIFLVGKWVDKKQQFVGFDILRHLNSLDDRLTLILYIYEKFNPQYYIQEAYFNNQTKQYNYQTLPFVDEIINMFFLYNTIDELIERKFYRQGKQDKTTKAELLKSSTWVKNEEMKALTKIFKTNPELYGKVYILSKYEPKDYLINFLFNEHYNCDSKLKSLF